VLLFPQASHLPFQVEFHRLYRSRSLVSLPLPPHSTLSILQISQPLKSPAFRSSLSEKGEYLRLHSLVVENSSLTTSDKQSTRSIPSQTHQYSDILKPTLSLARGTNDEGESVFTLRSSIFPLNLSPAFLSYFSFPPSSRMYSLVLDCTNTDSEMIETVSRNRRTRRSL